MPKRRRTNSWRDYGRAALNVGKQLAYNYAYRKVDNYSRTRYQARKTRQVAPLTAQHDFRTTYRRKPMPRKKKRRYVKSLKRFRSQQLRTSPSRIFQYVSCQQEHSGTNYCRYFGAFMGLYAQNNYDNNFGEAWNSITDGTTADEKAKAGGFRLDHQGIRCVLQNVTTGLPAGANGTIDVDVWVVTCIRDIPLELWPSGLGIESMMVTCKNRLRQPKGMDIEVSDTGTGIATAQQNTGASSTTQLVGDTLWNNPVFLRYWKISKQFKVQLPVGNITEFSMRSAKNRYIPRELCFDEGKLAAKAYVTQGYIFNINGRPYTTDGGAAWAFPDVTVNVEQYVRYNVKVVSGSAPTLVYDGV